MAREVWIPVSQAARESGYNIEYIRRLMRSGRVVGKKIITVWMVSRSSWLQYLTEMQKSGQKRGPHQRA